MKMIVEKEKCCGCSACVQICPKKCITLKEDKEGFLYPFINLKTCTHCNLCKSACPILANDIQNNKTLPSSYAVYNKSVSKRTKSSSGGLFYTFAKEALKKDGVVFGVVLNESFKAVHTYAQTEDELLKMLSSKYVQSDISNSYKLCKKFLEEKREVYFSGTPCQINGLLKYLNKTYDNLITQDFICHGVPSPKIWNKYIDFLEAKYDSQIKSVNFRNKNEGWKRFSLYIEFENGKVYQKNNKEDFYLTSFIKNLILRPSCYNCNFKTLNRTSDLTLADFWGAERIVPHLNDNIGLSLLLIQSEKGKKIFSETKNSFVFESVDIDTAISTNESIYKSAKKPKRRKKYIKAVLKKGFVKAEKYKKRSFLVKAIKKLLP